MKIPEGTYLKDCTPEKAAALAKVAKACGVKLAYQSYLDGINGIGYPIDGFVFREGEFIQSGFGTYKKNGLTLEEFVLLILADEPIVKPKTVYYTDNHRLEFDHNGARIFPMTNKTSYRMTAENFDKLFEVWEKHKNGL